MNGSRLIGLPEDFISTSRFICVSVLPRQMTAFTSQNQAMRAAYAAEVPRRLPPRRPFQPDLDGVVVGIC